MFCTFQCSPLPVVITAKIIQAGRYLRSSSSPSPAQGLVNPVYSRTCPPDLNISKDGSFTTSLANLFKYFTTLLWLLCRSLLDSLQNVNIFLVLGTSKMQSGKCWIEGNNYFPGSIGYILLTQPRMWLALFTTRVHCWCTPRCLFFINSLSSLSALSQLSDRTTWS